MKVLTFLNEKGGVGKTTLARHVAAGAALHDLRVLLIDTDTQGHCAQQLGLPATPGLYNLLVKQARWGAVVYEPEARHWSGIEPTIGRLLLLPSDINTRSISAEIDQSHPLLLRERLAELEGGIELVVIDTAPTPTLLQSVIMLASDFVVYPTQCQGLSLDGLAQSTQHMRDLDDVRATFGLAPLQLVGVVPTMFQGTLAHGKGLDLLTNHFGTKRVWEPIPHRTIWQQCEYEQQTLFAYAPAGDATQQMRQMVQKTLTTLQLTSEVNHA